MPWVVLRAKGGSGRPRGPDPPQATGVTGRAAHAAPPGPGRAAAVSWGTR